MRKTKDEEIFFLFGQCYQSMKQMINIIERLTPPQFSDNVIKFKIDLNEYETKIKTLINNNE